MSTEKGGAPGHVRRDPIAVGTLVLAAAAFAGSFTHIQATAATHSPAGTPAWLSWAIALMPELMVWLAVFRLRQVHGDPAAWVTLVSAGAFTVAANLAQAEPSPWGGVVAGWPAWAAISSALMLKLGGSRPVHRKSAERVKPQVSAPVTRPAEPVAERVTLRDVNRSTPVRDDRAERVKALRAQQVTWAEVARQVGVSVSTAKRLDKEVAA